MPRQFQFDPKRDRAWARKVKELAGEVKPKKTRKPTRSLTEQRIHALWPENRVKVERLISKLLAEQENR